MFHDIVNVRAYVHIGVLWRVEAGIFEKRIVGNNQIFVFFIESSYCISMVLLEGTVDRSTRFTANSFHLS